MENVYQAVDANKRKSWLVIIFFNLFVIGTIYLILAAFNYQLLGLFIAVAVALFSSLINYYYGDKMVIFSLKAKPIDKNDYPQVVQAVENISLATGLPMPRVYLISSSGLNAMATGRDPDHSTVLITQGLADILSKSELEAVIGHEFGHISNYDIRLMTFVSVAVGILTIFLDISQRQLWFRSDDNKQEGNNIMALLSLALIILAPFIAQLIQLAISRRREYLADAYSAKITRQPSTLISALIKINQAPQVPQAKLNTSLFFIANPFKNRKNFIVKWFSTHPPVEDRIQALEKMLS